MNNSNNTGNNNIVASKIKEWLTPGLILIISFFVKGWMNDVDTKLNQITAIQTQVTTIAVNVDRNKDDIKDLQTKTLAFTEAIKEDEITLESLKHKR